MELILKCSISITKNRVNKMFGLQSERAECRRCRLRSRAVKRAYFILICTAMHAHPPACRVDKMFGLQSERSGASDNANRDRQLAHGNQFSKIINSEMVILTPITINNHFNNANYVTKVDHLCSERHTFNFLLKKVDFRGSLPVGVDFLCKW